MDKTGTCNKSLNTIKTDLSLLLECLKFQMKCPDLQKQALLTIHSICEKREDNVDLLREMGGVAFVYNLSKSSIVHSDVKEAALFTLGTLVEANVYCKNSLCRKETFADFAGSLMKDDIPLTQKRVSVYLLSVLVANNKLGQTLAQTTGCLDILLDLFRSTFPLSTDATSVVANATHTYQLWTSVSNALCGCVNNPQNEEGQHICVAAFPIIKIWLQQIALQRIEIFQSICSFISMTVSNNSCVQESFSASGGLETLTLSLVRLASMADVRLSSYQLSVTISKTLSACVTDNSALASGLAQYGIVSHLFSLLASPYLDPEDRLSVLLTLGHCTEASEEHQSQLVQCGGLPLIITLLAEDKSEEVRKTATFILQTCKQAKGGREPHTANRQLFKPPRPVRHSVPKEIKCTDEEELLDQEMSKVVKITAKEQSLAHPRCAGCVLPFEKVTSRTFASLQSSCPHSCEMHKALQAATQQFRTRHCSLLRREDQDNTVELTSQNSKRVSATEPQRGKEYWSEVSLTPIRKGQGKCKRSLPAHHSKEHNGITLTPLHRGAKKETFTSYNKTATGRRGGNKGGQHVLDDEQRTSTDHCSTRRKRKDFSLEEVRYLLSGVKTFGFSWNSILWSYPFQPGRTNVALAKKYRQLMRGKTQDVACA
ncbi:telomere repeats-binding bouquet formation protein 1 isoform X2 [Seriola aureovittata]|uniref:telomere repeats-binding bouquet formation protein 1 isoform X2 n=1 Tax=Seriola aureovittata TaxID=2871759 RepID=UPI0024BEE239|nr:telomere repeats-binding bouquet formation protein 1 isoform X2 [Seriola aureovittata]